MAGNGGQFAVASPTITRSQCLRPSPQFASVSLLNSDRSRAMYHSRTFSVSLSKFAGRHAWKTGFDYRVLNHDGRPTANSGAYGFSDTFTRATPTLCDNRYRGQPREPIAGVRRFRQRDAFDQRLQLREVLRGICAG